MFRRSSLSARVSLCSKRTRRQISYITLLFCCMLLLLYYSKYIHPCNESRPFPLIFYVFILSMSIIKISFCNKRLTPRKKRTEIFCPLNYFLMRIFHVLMLFTIFLLFCYLLFFSCYYFTKKKTYKLSKL